MKKKNVLFMSLEVDLTARYNLILPYLAGYACLDPEIDAYWSFDSYRNSVHISPEQLEADMLEKNADIYAISCYVWNTGLIKQALYRFLDKKPNSKIILGGPQVSWQGKKYLSAKYPHLIICNGAGEKVFRNYLKELMNENADYSRLKGVCFYRGDTLMMTRNEERLTSLDEVPSPFSSKFFDRSKGYIAVDLETSRNCPFSCLYCCASTDNLTAKDSKLVRLSLERTKSDILEVAKNNIQYLGIVNPNFGLFSEDLEVASFIADCKKKYGFPTHIFTGTSRKHFDRLKKIAKLFHDAGITAGWEIPVQTLDDTAMKKINRIQNFSDYVSLTEFMNREGINSYAEYIWPLPGETLDSFKTGIAKLCRANSHVIFVYPFTFTNNIGMERYKLEYGIETVASEIPYSEDEFVIKTNEVSYEDNRNGCRFVLAEMVLYSLRALFMTARYLDSNHIESYRGLFDRFVSFILSKAEVSDHCYVGYMKKGTTPNEEILGAIIYAALYSDIKWFDEILFEFASSQTWWQDKNAQLFFELDLLNRGYLYKGTMDAKQHYAFKHVKMLNQSAGSYFIDIPTSAIGNIKEMLGIKASFDSNRIEISHNQKQAELDTTVSIKEKLFECTFVFISLFSYLPQWRDYHQVSAH